MSNTKSRPPRGRRSALWNHFTEIDNDNEFAQCNECHKKMSYKTTITNLKKHLSVKHPYIVIGTEGIKRPSEDILKEINNEQYEDGVDTPEIVECEEEYVPNYIITKKIRPLLPRIRNSESPSIEQTSQILKSKNNKSEMIQEAINILSNICPAEPISDYDEEDEFTQFGKYLIAQLRQLPLVNALQLQEKFQSLLTRERINIMLNDSQQKSDLKSNFVQCQCNHQHQHRSSQQQDQITETIQISCLRSGKVDEVESEVQTSHSPKTVSEISNLE